MASNLGRTVARLGERPLGRTGGLLTTRWPYPWLRGRRGLAKVRQRDPGEPRTAPSPSPETLTGDFLPGPARCTAAPALAHRFRTFGTGSPTPGCCRCRSAGQTVVSGLMPPRGPPPLLPGARFHGARCLAAEPPCLRLGPSHSSTGHLLRLGNFRHCTRLRLGVE